MRTLLNLVASIFAFAPIVAAQLHVGGLTTDPGAPIDFSASTATTPTAVGTSLPGGCTVGQQFFKSNNSPGTELYLCTATNTWTQITSGGGGGLLDPGANGVMKRTALNTTAAATATDISALDYVAGSGTAQAQTATLPTPITALTNGLNVCWLPVAANTAAAPTLTVNGLTAKPLTKYGTTPLVANDLTTTAIACAMYDGTEFQLQNPQTLPVFVKINGGAAVGPQTTVNFIPGTGLAGFTGIVNGSQIDVTLPIDTSYLNTNYVKNVVLPNQGATGTTLFTLTKLTGTPSTAVIAATTDTGGVIGITTAGAGTTGNATIQSGGIVTCQFDANAITAGHYVKISATTAGSCLDAGPGYPTSGQVIGRALASGSGGSAVSIELFGPELQMVPANVNVLTSGSGPVSDPGYSSDFQFNNASGALTFNVPAGVAGLQRCYRNATGKSGAITLQMAASNTVDLNGVNGSSAGTLVSTGALGDSVCLVSDGTNHWYASVQKGTWTNN